MLSVLRCCAARLARKTGEGGDTAAVKSTETSEREETAVEDEELKNGRNELEDKVELKWKEEEEENQRMKRG